MNEKLIVLLFLFVIVGFSIELSYDHLPEPTQEYDNLQVLVKPNRYVLYWTYNRTDITFEVIAKTNGWISFGLSPDGHMFYSDYVVAWVHSDGIGHFSGI